MSGAPAPSRNHANAASTVLPSAQLNPSAGTGVAGTDAVMAPFAYALSASLYTHSAVTHRKYQCWGRT